MTFFGHKYVPQEVYPILLATVTDLIENKKADKFFVGNQGYFDYMILKLLRALSAQYPHIQYAVVLTQPPAEQGTDGHTEMLFPKELTGVSPRYAVEKRNRWMLAAANTVVTYVTRSYGVAAKCKALAEKKGKRVIELSNLCEEESGERGELGCPNGKPM